MWTVYWTLSYARPNFESRCWSYPLASKRNLGPPPLERVMRGEVEISLRGSHFLFYRNCIPTSETWSSRAIATSLHRDVTRSALLKLSEHEISDGISLRNLHDQAEYMLCYVASQEESHPHWFERWWRRLVDVFVERIASTFNEQYNAPADATGLRSTIGTGTSSNKRRLSEVSAADGVDNGGEGSKPRGPDVFPFDLDIVDALVIDAFTRERFRLHLPLINTEAAHEIRSGKNMRLAALEGDALMQAALFTEIYRQCVDMHHDLAEKICSSMRRKEVLALLLIKSGGNRFQGVSLLGSDKERAEYLNKYIAAWTRSLGQTSNSLAHLCDLVRPWVRTSSNAVMAEFPSWRLIRATKVSNGNSYFSDDFAPRKRRSLVRSEVSSADILDPSSTSDMKSAPSGSSTETQPSPTVPGTSPLEDSKVGGTSAQLPPVGQPAVPELSSVHPGLGGRSNLAIRASLPPLNSNSHHESRPLCGTQNQFNITGNSIPLSCILHSTPTSTETEHALGEQLPVLALSSIAGLVQDNVENKEGPQDFVPPPEDRPSLSTTSSNFVEPGFVLFRR